MNSRLREIFLVLVGVALLVALLLPRNGAARMSADLADGHVAAVHVYNEAGELVGPVAMPRVEKSEAEWQAQLTGDQYRIVRQAGTEPAFTGALLANKAQGVYGCVACGLPLFASGTKFESGTGWPSFHTPIAGDNVAEHVDRSYDMVRTEINCARCSGHLGHVFNDGPQPTGLRYCLNSASLAFTPTEAVRTLADPAVAGSPAPQATVVLAGGCFWCVEAVFEEVDGVLVARSGYAGGTPATATYRKVSSGQTQHAEVVQIIYDPATISFEDLLRVFFLAAHDPTQLDRQGNDHGRQYRSAIFYAGDTQRAAAQKVIDQLISQKAFGSPIVTTFEPLTGFYLAEEYHQDYVRRNPNDGYVRSTAIPKVQKVRKLFKDHLKPQPAEQPDPGAH